MSKSNAAQGLSSSLRDHGYDHLELWLAVFTGEGSCKGGSCNEALKDLLHLELVLWDVIEPCYQDNAPRA